MITPNAAHYKEIFDYLSAPSMPESAEPAVVFGRKDPLVAHALGDLVIPGLVETAIITGGIGKDSGNLVHEGFRSESHYLHRQLDLDAATRGYDLPPISLDEKASNGGENSRNSLDILLAQGVGITSLTAVAHATSLRRLSETLKFEANKKTGIIPITHRKPSAHEFDARNPTDRDEAAAELLRLADWPAKGVLGEQTDLPPNLIDFVRDTHGKAPPPIAPWQSAILRRLPKKLRLGVIEFAADRGRK